MTSRSEHMTPGELYWRNRSIELGARMYCSSTGLLPGMPQLIGEAHRLPGPDGQPVVRYWRRKGWSQCLYDHNPDDWQPVNRQETMF